MELSILQFRTGNISWCPCTGVIVHKWGTCYRCRLAAPLTHIPNPRE
jgi:hypothetical protein